MYTMFAICFEVVFHRARNVYVLAQERRDDFLSKVKEVHGEHQLDQKTLQHLLV